MDAIVTAGGIPLPEESLYSETKGHNKALLDIAGKPMIQWVLDALSGAKTIDNVIIVGLTEKAGLSCRKPVHYISNQGRMLDNFRAGVNKSLELGTTYKHVLFVSADIPAISPEMVDWVVKTALKTDDDIYYNIIQREVMEKRFPESKRTYTRLKDMDVCGGDMNVARSKMVVTETENGLWEKISNARKSPLKQAALIGFDTLFLLLFRQLSLEKAAEKICKKLDITGQVIVCPYAEAGMDVDKPHQLEIMRKDFKKRLKKAEKTEIKPVKKAGKKPAKKAARKPAEKPAKKPVKKPVKKPAKK
jgi:GTP:adenosylcobinamide-phosphate guanylyltransferase